MVIVDLGKSRGEMNLQVLLSSFIHLPILGHLGGGIPVPTKKKKKKIYI